MQPHATRQQAVSPGLRIVQTAPGLPGQTDCESAHLARVDGAYSMGPSTTVDPHRTVTIDEHIGHTCCGDDLAEGTEAQEASANPQRLQAGTLGAQAIRSGTHESLDEVIGWAHATGDHLAHRHPPRPRGRRHDAAPWGSLPAPTADHRSSRRSAMARSPSRAEPGHSPRSHASATRRSSTT